MNTGFGERPGSCILKQVSCELSLAAAFAQEIAGHDGEQHEHPQDRHQRDPIWLPSARRPSTLQRPLKAAAERHDRAPVSAALVGNPSRLLMVARHPRRDWCKELFAVRTIGPHLENGSEEKMAICEGVEVPMFLVRTGVGDRMRTATPPPTEWRQAHMPRLTASQAWVFELPCGAWDLC